ncbi:hypothetical protein Q3C19_11020, partial [Bacteroides sp. ET489]|uniref:hypothetical protein n=1 Tax=Bacteroides sp. ET489 TaxID=3057126 RepID=UPI00267199A1
EEGVLFDTPSSFFPQLGKYFFLTREEFFPNWEKIRGREGCVLSSENLFEKEQDARSISV